MEIEEFESKLKNKTFTEEELQELVQDYLFTNQGDRIEYEIIDTIYDNELNRWSRNVQTIIKYKNKYYSILWEEGLTEYQDNGFYEQPYEVIKKTKVIEQDYWISPDKEEKETQPNVFILKNGLFNIRTTKNTKIAILDGQWECIERID